jgi:hypothetical protein
MATCFGSAGDSSPKSRNPKLRMSGLALMFRQVAIHSCLATNRAPPDYNLGGIRELHPLKPSALHGALLRQLHYDTHMYISLTTRHTEPRFSMTTYEPEAQSPPHQLLTYNSTCAPSGLKPTRERAMCPCAPGYCL